MVSCDREGLACDVSGVQGYRLGDAQLQFQIAVQVDASSSLTSSTETLNLSPRAPTVICSRGNVSVTLLGDLANYQSSPNFGYAILMIPSPAGEL